MLDIWAVIHILCYLCMGKLQHRGDWYDPESNDEELNMF